MNNAVEICTVIKDIFLKETQDFYEVDVKMVGDKIDVVITNDVARFPRINYRALNKIKEYFDTDDIDFYPEWDVSYKIYQYYLSIRKSKHAN